MRNKIITLAYFLTGVIYIVLYYKVSFLPAFIIKSLLMPLLFLYLLMNSNKTAGMGRILMMAGIIFSWGGDVILEASRLNDNLFLFGLLSFLLAQIMYLTKFFTTPGKNLLRGIGLFIIIPLLIFGITLIGFLKDNLGDMLIPVTIYAAVILTMLAGAINRRFKVPPESYILVLAGAFLFVISDSAIAVNRFGHPFELSRVVVMSTYISAQYLIVLGYTSENKIKAD